MAGGTALGGQINRNKSTVSTSSASGASTPRVGEGQLAKAGTPVSKQTETGLSNAINTNMQAKPQQKDVMSTIKLRLTENLKNQNSEQSLLDVLTNSLFEVTDKTDIQVEESTQLKSLYDAAFALQNLDNSKMDLEHFINNVKMAKEGVVNFQGNFIEGSPLTFSQTQKLKREAKVKIQSACTTKLNTLLIDIEEEMKTHVKNKSKPAHEKITSHLSQLSGFKEVISNKDLQEKITKFETGLTKWMPSPKDT